MGSERSHGYLERILLCEGDGRIIWLQLQGRDSFFLSSWLPVEVFRKKKEKKKGNKRSFLALVVSVCVTASHCEGTVRILESYYRAFHVAG